MISPVKLATCDSITEFPADLSNYVMEPKLDGMRLQFVVDETGVQAVTRSGKSANGKLPHIEAMLQWAYDMWQEPFVIDGEAVYIDEHGSPDFNLTMRIMGSGTVKAVDRQLEYGTVSFLAFDLPYYGGDKRDETLRMRHSDLKSLINGIGQNYPYIKVVPQFEPSQKNLDDIIELYKEGAVLKHKDGAYGGRKSWLKYKMAFDADVVVMGYTEGTGKYADLIGAVRFGQIRGGVMKERGQCSGMTDEQRTDFAKNGDKYLGQVMVIGHMGLAAPNDESGFRHPQFKHFRDDKAPEQCFWDLLDGTRDDGSV